MGKLTHWFVKILLLITSCICVGITMYNYISVPIDLNGTMYIPKQYHDTYYEMLSDNVGITTVNGLGNVYANMVNDGYSIYSENITEHSVDVTFVKPDSLTFRYYFEYPSGKITFFCSQYESSYIGSTYIIEERNK